jgi:lysozyme family protein
MSDLMTDDPCFMREVARLKGVEGGYSNDKKDSGGETKYGITKQVARAYKYEGAMRDLTWDKAMAIYWEGWWKLLNLDEISVRSEAIAAELFDTAVNCGQGIASKFFQRALNVLNREQKDYPDLKVDGLLGAVTLDAFDAYMELRGKRGELVMLRILNSLQGARYVEIAEARRKDERYTFGWFLQRVRIQEDV